MPLHSAQVASPSLPPGSFGGAAHVPATDGATCFHCGQPNADPQRWTFELDGALRHFCCAGCLGVARTIDAAGLTAFYGRRSGPGEVPLPDRDAPDEWSRWDAAPAQAEYVRAGEGGVHETSLLIEGIHCGACVWLVESWLQRRPGVRSVAVNFATHRARVAWDPATVRLSEILRAVVAIGYRASPYDPARREALAQRDSRALLLRVAVALLAMMQVMMFSVPTYITIDGVEPAHRLLLEWASLTLTLPAILYSAAPIFRGAWRDVARTRLGMDVPVALALTAAFAASAFSTLSGGGPVYYDSVTMFIALLLSARYVEQVALRRAGEAIETLARARPPTAERLPGWPVRRDAETVGAASLVPGDIVLTRAGGTIPADGDVVDGAARVEEAVLSGESRPKAVAPGDAVLAGSIVRDGALIVRVAAAGEATRLAAIERLAERAAGHRPRVARIADRVAAVFVAVLLALAAGTVLAWWQIDPARALEVTFAVLVVSCPCALSLATPAALAAGAGALSRRHVVVARADALETLARVTHVAFDKTGTLTTGTVSLLDVMPQRGATRAEVLALAAALEAHSEHPLAGAFRREGSDAAPLPAVEAIRVVPGSGIEGAYEGRRVRLGRPEFVAALSGSAEPADAARIAPSATTIALGDDRGWLALFAVGDEIRPGARSLVQRLRGIGIVPLLLSGDRRAPVSDLAKALGIAEARASMQPADKRDAIARLQADGAVVAMVGDGINDAPSLAQAQVSVSLGSATPLAQWTADVVVLSEDLGRIFEAIVHARRTFRIIGQNLVWALAYNLVAIPAAVLGHVSPLVAALGMSVSSLVVVGNALRAGRSARTAVVAHPAVRATAAR